METTNKNFAGDAESSIDDMRQLVSFSLDTEIFGVDIANVREIIRMIDITQIPQSPEFVEGIINLRGSIIPIIDLKKRFGLFSEKERDKQNRIIVIETGNTTIGFIVDEVNEVLRIKSTSIEPTPHIATSEVESRYIQGVTMLEDEKMLILLDFDKIFTEQENQRLNAIG